MAEDHYLIHRRISSRLTRTPDVRRALQRLNIHGKRSVGDIEALALDNTAALDLRLDAITVLMAMESANADVLRRLVDSDDRLIIIETLKRIRTFAPDWAIPDLIVRASAWGDPSKRAVIAWALAAYPNSSDAQSTLLQIMNEDIDAAVREHAIESLSEFHSPVVIDALLRRLEHGSGGERFWCLYSLGTLADARADDVVRRYLEDQTSIPDFGTVADEARWALEEIRRKARQNSSKAN